MGDEGEKVESEFIKIVPPENGWWGVETYQISLHQTEARAIAERDEIAKWLAPILRQVEREARRDYRDRFARRLALNHMSKLVHSRYDIIVALDGIEDDIQQAKEGA